MAPTEPQAWRTRVESVAPTSQESLVAAVVAGATSAAAAAAVEIQTPQAAGAAGAGRRSLRPARRLSCMNKGSKPATVL